MTTIAPLGRYRAFDANGNPLAGGKLYTYEAGTNTPKDTYKDNTTGTANTNPVILDADGYADVWLDVGGYKFTLHNSADALQWTKDNITGGGSVGFASQVVSRSSSFSLSVNDKNFVIVCTAALTVSLLPAATAGDGFTAVIVNMSAGNVTIDPDGSETINNASTLVIGPSNSAILSTDGTEWYAYGYTQTEFSDSVFRVVDNADTTKKLAFEVSGVTTGTTTTLSVTNNSISLPATGSLESQIVLQERLASGGSTATIVPLNGLTANRTYTLPDQTGTFLTSAGIGTVTAAMIAAGVPKQVQSTTKTDTFTTTSTSFTDITGLSVSITPQSASSRVLVIAVVDCICNAVQGALRLTRGGSAIAVGDAAGSRVQASAGIETGTAFGTISKVIAFFDNPATTSATTYAVQATLNGVGNFYCNRSGDDSNASTRYRTVSTIMAIEV